MSGCLRIVVDELIVKLEALRLHTLEWRNLVSGLESSVLI